LTPSPIPGKRNRVTLSEANFWMGMVATAAFAVTAVAAIQNRRVDLFGVLVLGAITAVGGGTIRDLILDVPVFWAENPIYIWVAIAASAIAFFGRSLVTEGQTYSIMLYLDGLGAAFFAMLAVEKVWKLGFGLPLAPVILGVITAIGGGLVRDVLAGRPTLLMSKELYAVPLLFACSLFAVVLTYAPEYRLGGIAGCVILSFLLRSAAIHWKIHMPAWLITKS
jgi:uncharacterized membrane protein YeiH